MITVQDVISDNIFKEFRLVAGHKGLYNQVTGTGILDWEGVNDVVKDFSKGEFVLTTLGETRDQPELLVDKVKTLIGIQVAAICIKTIFFKTVPKTIIKMAEDNNVPIFMFENTYFDDIIFSIRSSLNESRENNAFAKQIEDILWNETISLEEAEKTLKTINPFLYENYECIYLTTRFQKDRRNSALIDEQCEKIQKYFQNNIDSEEEFHVVMNLRKAILVIFSVRKVKDNEELESMIDGHIKRMALRERMCVGISNPHTSFRDFAFALKESFYANISALVDRDVVLKYKELGTDAILIPICNNSWIRNIYETELGKLGKYDKQHNAKLLDTLLTFIESEGNISLTSVKMFQHENTIRHRIKRIESIIQTDNTQEDTYVQMYLLARLYKIHQFL